MKVICVDHIGIACEKSLEEASKFYTDVLGLKVTGTEKVLDQGVATVFVPCGETLLELLVDITPDKSGPIGKFVAKNGPGIQHVALRVDDCESTLAELQEKGVRVIDKHARGGAGNMNIGFLHPKAAGLLLEVCSPKA